MTPEEKQEMRLIALREGIGLIVGLAVWWVMTSPKARLWMERQEWLFSQRRDRLRNREALLVAELYRDISRFEHRAADS
jgi:hypothetical protein